MKTIKYNNYLFFDKKVIGNAKQLMKKFGIKRNSYAGEVVKRLFSYCFEDAVKIKKEYNKYYKKEFGNYKDYLECHFEIPQTLIEKICEKNVCYVNLEEKGDRIGELFWDNDELKSEFWDLLGGLEHENKNRLHYE